MQRIANPLMVEATDERCEKRCGLRFAIDFHTYQKRYLRRFFATFHKRVHGFVSSCTFLNAFSVPHATFFLQCSSLTSLSLSRYIDDTFMTTNQTIDEIHIELRKAEKKDINIEINASLSTSVNFLDVTIVNEDGHLRTSVYHQPTAEPYFLPYTSDHPRHIHRNIPYAALFRDARIYSHVDDFNSERIRIDMSLLLNGYP